MLRAVGAGMGFLIWMFVFFSVHVIGRPSITSPEKQSPAASTYDYIIAGCGASGLVVANRLSEVKGITVLCLEAGAFDKYEDYIQVPYFVGLQPYGFYDWLMYTVPQAQLDGKSRHIPAGLGVGGGSLINGMVWNRGNQESFNSWATLGNDGWGWADLLPYFQKSENFTPKSYSDQTFPAAPTNSSVHGTYGPVQVSYPSYFWEQSNNWFDALESLGIPFSKDPNEGLTAGGYFLPLNIDPVNQTRSDARRVYYDPAHLRTNLLVCANSTVTQILFNNSSGGLRATGVQYVQSPNGPVQTLYAAREVIIAAGALHTPQLLELSGIGPRAVLEENGIRVLSDLPGVGNNLQDHPLIHLSYPYTKSNLIDVNTMLTNLTFNKQCSEQYYASKTGPWTAKPSQAVAFLSLHQFLPDPTSMLKNASINAMDYLPPSYDSTLRAGYEQQLATIITELSNSSTPAFENLNNNAGSLDISLMRPLSRGTCHINSSNPLDNPTVDPRWLIHPFDYTIMAAAMAFNQKILDTPSIQTLQPTYLDVPYNATDAELRRILSISVGTEYHYAGTAAMMPRELGGVVDANLTVYGTVNLRIVDTSVYPVVPGAHLQAVAYAVAEKAADLIKGVVPGPAKA